MEVTKSIPGSFCWFELATTDQTAAKQFYGNLFGWTATDAPMGPDACYTTFFLNGRKVGATYTLMPDQVQAGVPAHWGTYVAVAKADDAVAKAKTLGAEVIMGPMNVAEHGVMAILRDPTSAVISVWQPKQHLGVQVWEEDGAFGWSELMTRDTKAATAFYTALFGWTTKVNEGIGMPYTHWQNNGTDIGGMIEIQKEWGPMPAHWINYVQVKNCDETVAKSTSLGGKTCMPPTDIPKTGRFAMLQDPQGAMFCVIALLPR